MDAPGFATVLTTPELGPGAMAEVEAGGRRLVVLNIAQTYYALDGTCTGCGQRLAETGTIRDDTLVCTNDDATFDVHSGARVDRAGDPLLRYAIRISGNEISIGPPLGD
jgi:nitrite reductase/ring-hydroxylating ferredoxin subunit